MSVSTHLIQRFAGDVPNIIGVEQYLENAFHAIQQMDSRLWDLFPTKNLPTSTRALWIPIIDEMDASNGYMDTMSSGMVTAVMGTAGAEIQATSASTRYGFTQNMTLSNRKRHLYGTAYRGAPLVERIDLDSNAWIDVMQNYLTALDYRWNRYRDSSILTMLAATTVLEGRDNTTTGALPTATVAYLDTYSVLGGADTIADRALMEKIIYEFESRNVNISESSGETPILICPPRVKQQLRASGELINKDYTNQDVVDKREMLTASGFQLRLMSPGLMAASGGKIRCYAVVPSGCMTAEWGTMYSRTSIRNDRNDALQALQEYVSGAVRVQDAKVIWFDVKDVAPSY